MSNHTPSSASVQVMFRSPDAFYIRETGRTYIASADHVARRFGSGFAEAVASTPREWIDFDDDRRAEPVPVLVTPRPITRRVATFKPETLAMLGLA